MRINRLWPLAVLSVVLSLLTGCFGFFGSRTLYSIVGTVTDGEGNGLADVQVSSTGQAKESTTTAEDGSYELEKLWGQNTIAARKVGWKFEGPYQVAKGRQLDFVGEEKWVNLTVSVEGLGSVVRPGHSGDVSGKYPYDDTIELLAVPDGGWGFVRWDGDAHGSENSLLLAMVDDLELTAVFEKLPPVQGTIEVRHVFSGQHPSAGTGTLSVSAQRSPQRLSTYDVPGLEPEPEPDTEELIIGMDPSVDPAEAVQLLAKMGYEVLDRLVSIGAYLVRPRPGLMRPFSLDQNEYPIRYVEPNATVYALGVVEPNDELYPLQWHYPLIRLPQAWSITTGDSSVRVAVVDSGVVPSHPDLAGHLDTVYGYDFVSNSSAMRDPNGHGTHVAGTIGAVTNNGLGVAGVMWDVEILPIRVLNAEGRGSVLDVARGLLYAVGIEEPGSPRNPYPAQVVNLSLGMKSENETLREAVAKAVSTGALIVAAAGNASISSDAEGVWYPAAFPGVIAVGAVGYNYGGIPKVTYYSRYGPEIDFVAPGGIKDVDSDGDEQDDMVLSTSGTDGYGYMRGTSMAAPHVSGVIGLMLANGVPREQVVEVLQRTSIPLGPDEFSIKYGYGLINAYWAVNQVDSIAIMVGTREGNIITPVAETTISPKGGSFRLEAVPPGEYQVFAWLDVVKDGQGIEPGDYFAESPVLTFAEDKAYVISGYIAEVTDEMELDMEFLRCES